MNQQGDISGFTKAIWSGVTAIELAKAVMWAIDNKTTGLYHITNNQPINKYDLLLLFKKHTQKNIEVLSVEGRNVDKSFIDTRKLINYSIPSYDEMIRDMVQLIIDNQALYDQYEIGQK